MWGGGGVIGWAWNDGISTFDNQRSNVPAHQNMGSLSIIAQEGEYSLCWCICSLPSNRISVLFLQNEWVHRYELCREYELKMSPADHINFVDGIIFVQKAIEQVNILLLP